jgi:hypothetical protein
MRKNIESLALALLVLLISTAAYAQDEASISIPFGFVIQDRAFPAGTYVLSKVADPQVLFLRRNGSPSDSAVFFVQPHTYAENDHFEFQFSKTGDDMFLTRIRTRLGDANVVIAKSKGAAHAPAAAKILAVQTAAK